MLGLALAAIAADQLTKATVVHRLRVGEAVDVLPGLSFWHVRNTGIALGVPAGRLNSVVLLTVGAVIWMLAFLRPLGCAASAHPRCHRVAAGGQRPEPLGSAPTTIS